MTEQEKELLLKDLCARVPYNIMVEQTLFPPPLADKEQRLKSVQANNVVQLYWYKYINEFVPIHCIKPYLRPMSSMTEEERNEWADLFNLELNKLNSIDDENKAEELAPYYFGKSHQVSIDWLNSHHFDYRGLIEKGLALEAPKDMYNFK